MFQSTETQERRHARIEDVRVAFAVGALPETAVAASADDCYFFRSQAAVIVAVELAACGEFASPQAAVAFATP